MLLNSLFHHIEANRSSYRNIVSPPIMGKPTPLSTSKSKRARHSTDQAINIHQGEASGSGVNIESDDEEGFHSQTNDEKLTTIYRNLREVKKEQRGIKKLLTTILDYMKCTP